MLIDSNLKLKFSVLGGVTYSTNARHSVGIFDILESQGERCSYYLRDICYVVGKQGCKQVKQNPTTAGYADGAPKSARGKILQGNQDL